MIHGKLKHLSQAYIPDLSSHYFLKAAAIDFTVQAKLLPH